MNALICPRRTTAYFWGRSTPNTAEHRRNQKENSGQERDPFYPHSGATDIRREKRPAEGRVQRQNHPGSTSKRRSLRVEVPPSLPLIPERLRSDGRQLVDALLVPLSRRTLGPARPDFLMSLRHNVSVVRDADANA